MIKAILFDFDGVLARSNALYLKEYLALFKKHGIPVQEKALLAHFGEEHLVLFHHFASKKKFNILHREYHKKVLTPSFYKKIRLISGVRTMLQRLSYDHSLGLCTGAPRKTLRYLRNELGLKHYFRYLSCADDVRHGKPAPDLLLRALSKLHVKPSEAIYIGDAPRDYLSAKRAGVPFIAVLTGVLTRSECRKLKIKQILSDVTKLPHFLERLN
ncbi:MAG: HAD family hydrolase [Nanoarchaeota archaeon]